MAESKKNNPIYVIVLAAILLLVIYVVFIKDDKASGGREMVSYERMGGNQVVNPQRVSETPLLGSETNDTNEIPTKRKRLESIDDLEEGLRNAIRTIDNNLDKAYDLESGTQRTALLLRTKSLIDSLLAIYDNPFLYVSLGDLYMLKPDFVKAAANYGIAKERIGDINGLARNLAMACYNAAGAKLNANDTDAAIGYMEAYLDRFSEDEKAKELLAYWYLKRAVGMLSKSDNEGGLSRLETAYTLNPSDYSINFNKGIAHFRLGQDEEAITHFEKCTAIREGDRYAGDYLFIIYSRLGENEKAQQYYTEPEDVEIPVKQNK